jgi:5'-methylthioadenosine phosphorylase
VEVDAVVENLHANSALAKRILRSVIPMIPETPASPAHRALDAAVFTPREMWPQQTLENLAPILGRFG